MFDSDMKTNGGLNNFSKQIQTDNALMSIYKIILTEIKSSKTFQ
jgi:hypothetical protein